MGDPSLLDAVVRCFGGDPVRAYEYIGRNDCMIWQGSVIREGRQAMETLWKRMTVKQRRACEIVLEEHYTEITGRKV